MRCNMAREREEAVAFVPVPLAHLLRWPRCRRLIQGTLSPPQSLCSTERYRYGQRTTLTGVAALLSRFATTWDGVGSACWIDIACLLTFTPPTSLFRSFGERKRERDRAWMCVYCVVRSTIDELALVMQAPTSPPLPIGEFRNKRTQSTVCTPGETLCPVSRSPRRGQLSCPDAAVGLCFALPRSSRPHCHVEV
ncbi:uncharacterized protein LY79DRAFT_124444 [Colletotrichum navitas]|uniref:Uncharacterized protein n=1 Tax=Colletotrichum navitas TaxID=681940 RepID=A0AAD8Q3B8_9PEZI|nr:uncharacterized protein LY79DRAFT_124444 [Colletotrichum navitas]KAK1594760.1 hypothetical protein LY79DRAFT_124444 [Colletotrichum navitas]